MKEVSLMPINSHVRLGGSLHANRAGSAPNSLSPHPITKRKKYSGYPRTVNTFKPGACTWFVKFLCPKLHVCVSVHSSKQKNLSCRKQALMHK